MQLSAIAHWFSQPHRYGIDLPPYRFCFIAYAIPNGAILTDFLEDSILATARVCNVDVQLTTIGGDGHLTLEFTKESSDNSGLKLGDKNDITLNARTQFVGATYESDSKKFFIAPSSATAKDTGMMGGRYTY